MQWFSDLLKYVGVSKLFAFAVFITSTAFLFGPRYLSNQIPVVSGGWRILAWLCVFFTGTYLFVWVVQWLWGWVSSLMKTISYWWYSRNLTERDIQLIVSIAGEQFQTKNLRMFHQAKDLNVSIIEIKQHAKSLVRTGLVEVGPHDDYIVSLTERGKQYAARLSANRRST